MKDAETLYHEDDIFESDNIIICSSCDLAVNDFGKCLNCGCKVCKNCLALTEQSLCHACLEGKQDY